MAASLCGVLFPYSTPFPNTFRAKVAVTWDFGRENYKGFLDSKFPTCLCMVDQVHFGGGGAVLFFYFQKVGGVHLRQIDSTSIVPGVAGRTMTQLIIRWAIGRCQSIRGIGEWGSENFVHI